MLPYILLEPPAGRCNPIRQPHALPPRLPDRVAASSRGLQEDIRQHGDESRTGCLSMIGIIILLVAAIALIIGLSVAGNSSSNDVTTVNAVGQIGGDVILSCTFTPDVKKSSNVLWEKVGDTGVVYKYENGKIVLTDQNPNFSGRTLLFVNQLSAGNASLKISNVQMKDAGGYKCTISNSNGQGSNKLTLDVGAFSDVTLTNISQTTLRCSSPSWYPVPTVSWLNVSSGATFPNVSTTLVPGLSSSVQVLSDFTNAKEDVQYRCVIQNNLAKAQGDAIFTVLGLKTQTQLTVLGSAHMTSPSRLLLSLLILVLCLGAVDL
ncbi:V-set domain-containing T-cell activation inhibitor 1-like [Dendropsophus ebraccatus]|uniref:V-set domain-containing T-cell activation inhibitor 1-like n=1 Tax=Dendropsophus ebraccatus TaxID=150705 RepID=UPI0038313C01